MDETNDLEISIGADPSDLRRGMQEAESIVEQGGRRISSSLDRIGNLGQKLAGIGAGLTASITLPIVGLATESVKAYAKIESLELGLESVAGSAEKAGAEMRQLREVAKLPGLGLQEAVKGSINLQAIGFQAGKAETILSEFGNAIATVGKGRVEFDRAIYGITQLANTEFPLGEDLNIVADALPQVRTLLKDTFGKTRSDDLAKMGVTSKQVVDTIIEGLSKLPRVSGGISNAFENAGDSIQQSLGRLGKSIDTAFDISGIVNKLTDTLDNLITKFEDLSPTTQKVILVTAGLAAATGPVLLGLGAILSLIPVLVTGYNSLTSAVLATTRAMLANPYTAIAIAIAAIAVALAGYYSTVETASDRQDRWSRSLAHSVAEGEKEVQSLSELYRKSQDQKVSLEERKKAVDDLQKQYPNYFSSLSQEAILVGKASGAYRQLQSDIMTASRTRAAQAELDKRNATQLEKELEIREEQTKAEQDYIKAVEKGQITGSRQGLIRTNAVIAAGNKELAKLRVEFNQENRALIGMVEEGATVVKKVYGDYANAPDLSLAKGARKGTQEWYKEEIKRLQDLQDKAIVGSAEWTKYGALIEKYNKLLNPDKSKETFSPKTEGWYETEISRLEALKKRAVIGTDAWMKLNEQINKYNEKLSPSDLEPVKFESKGLLDNFGNEFKSINDLLTSEALRTYEILNTQLPAAFNEGFNKLIEESARIAELKEKLNRDFNNLISSSVASTISDTFNSLGEAIAKGGNVMENVGKALLKSLGTFVSKMGTMLIEYGTLAVIKGKLDIATQVGGPTAIATGVAAIAIGAALSVVGSAIGSFAGSGGNSSSDIPSTTGANTPSYSSSNYSANGSGGEYVFRLSGPDLIAVFNRNVSAQDKVTAG